MLWRAAKLHLDQHNKAAEHKETKFETEPALFGVSGEWTEVALPTLARLPFIMGLEDLVSPRDRAPS
jgi:hypothetical protein